MVMSESTEESPAISIIIPFLNNQDEVVSIVNRIREQNKDLQPEIICVDNGSDCGTDFSAEFMELQVVIRERNFLHSPYSARNRGIEKAVGDVVVFVDANSLPADGWLQNGLRCLEKTGVDIAAGRVDFEFGGKPNAANIVDAITSIHQKKSVEQRQAAFTANLFVKRTVFESVGLFEEGVRSGGDVRWTMKASAAGHVITYCPDSIVLKKARSYSALIKKRVRTGRGYLYTWLSEETRSVWFYNFLRSLKPPSLDTPEDLYRKRYSKPLPVNAPSVWVSLYMMSIVEQLSFMAEYLRYNLGTSRDKNRQKEMGKKL